MSRLGQDAEIPSYSKKSRTYPGQVVTKERAKVPKGPRAVKQVNVDVFIPSVVTVGNLARLLNISLGMPSQTVQFLVGLLIPERYTAPQDDSCRDGIRSLPRS